MKRLVILTCLLAAALAATKSPHRVYKDFMDDLQTSAKYCGEKINVTKEIVDVFLEDLRRTDVEQMGCLRACVFEEQHILVDGKLSFEAVEEVLKALDDVQPVFAVEIRKLGGECAEKTKDIKSKCELVTEFMNCLIDGVEAIQLAMIRKEKEKN